MEALTFNITEWEIIKVDKDIKLPKKLRRICKFFGIPIPPRKVFVDAKIKVDAPEGMICVHDSILILEPECLFHVTRPPENGYYFISSTDSIWYPFKYVGPSAIMFHALGETSK